MYQHDIIYCNADQHAESILAIFNDAILHSTALYDYQPRTLASMETWFANKRAGHFPVVGIENTAGELLAFGSYGTFRAWPAYKYTVEHSVYVRADQRGQGLGKIILAELIKQAEQQHYHVMVGVIDQNNHVSIALHEKLGFQHAGTLQQIGFKFGHWLDTAFYQKQLSTPANPQDG